MLGELSGAVGPTVPSSADACTVVGISSSLSSHIRAGGPPQGPVQPHSASFLASCQAWRHADVCPRREVASAYKDANPRSRGGRRSLLGGGGGGGGAIEAWVGEVVNGLPSGGDIFDDVPSGGDWTVVLEASGADGLILTGLGIGTVVLILQHSLLHALNTVLITSLFLIALLLLHSRSLDSVRAANLFWMSSLMVAPRGVGLAFTDFLGCTKPLVIHSCGSSEG